MEYIHFIINPQAKNGYSLKVWNKVKQELENKKVSYKEFFTEYRGHGTTLAEIIKRDNKNDKIVMIVIGGDGTLHEVINGVAHQENVFVGFIPAGSGNDFMRGYRIPKDPISALNYILKLLNEEPTKVDVGEIVDEKNRKTFFVNNMGAGFDALVTKEVNNSPLKKFLNKISLGNLTYAYFVIIKIFSFKRTNVIVNIDGKPHHFDDTWFVTVSNQPFYGGGMKISPEASVLDGKLNVTVVHQLSRLKFLLVFITVFWGGHTRFKEVKNFIGKDISIFATDPLFVHADGEYIGETPIHIRTLSRNLPILTREIE